MSRRIVFLRCYGCAGGMTALRLCWWCLRPTCEECDAEGGCKVCRGRRLEETPWEESEAPA